MGAAEGSGLFCAQGSCMVPRSLMFLHPLKPFILHSGVLCSLEALVVTTKVSQAWDLGEDAGMQGQRFGEAGPGHERCQGTRCSLVYGAPTHALTEVPNIPFGSNKSPQVSVSLAPLGPWQ